MEDKDHLKEILGKIDQINEPIDLEEIILNAIRKEEKSKTQITRYKEQGVRALIVSGVFIVILGILFSLPNSISSVEYAIVTYASIILALCILFIQLEMGSARIFNNQKNNMS